MMNKENLILKISFENRFDLHILQTYDSTSKVDGYIKLSKIYCY